VGVLAGKMGVTLPTVSATLERLVRAGYVEREDDPEDRRVVINRLTAAGTSLVERLREERRARVDQALRRLTPEQMTVLQEGLSALAGALGLVRPMPSLDPAGGPTG
jgi:DNA-binding MarR family transcriptional regulator